MKHKSILTLMSLATVFFVTWAIKVHTPINRPSNTLIAEYTPWYLNTYSAPVAEDKWYIDAELDPNYLPVPGMDEVYMVLDSSGNIIKYRQRKKTDDGSWVWSDYTEDTGIEAVDGQNGVYLVTDEDGNQRYKKYVRNADNTYCYVETDEKGTPIDIGSDATTITPEYSHIDGNTYAKYNDDGVMEGYRERVDNGDGTFSWDLGDAPSLPSANMGGISFTNPTYGGGQTTPQNGQLPEFGGGVQDVQIIEGVPLDGEAKRIENADGTYTITETIRNTETINGEKVTTETTVSKTYDANGDIMESYSTEPKEVAREVLSASQQPNPSDVASSLSGEEARVGNSLTYDTTKAQEVLSYLNAERTKAGLSALTMDPNSEAYKIAAIKAGDMATYDYSGNTSPLYGTLGDLCDAYGCTTNGDPAENILKMSTLSANDIHLRFQSDENSRMIRMDENRKSVGIAIVEKDGINYVAEVYLN